MEITQNGARFKFFVPDGEKRTRQLYTKGEINFYPKFLAMENEKWLLAIQTLFE